jgi:hypothetical protein
MHPNHILPTYDGLEARQTAKLQNRRPLSDVELYLTVHKSFVSTSLNIILNIHRGCMFHLRKAFIFGGFSDTNLGNLLMNTACTGM